MVTKWIEVEPDVPQDEAKELAAQPRSEVADFNQWVKSIRFAALMKSPSFGKDAWRAAGTYAWPEGYGVMAFYHYTVAGSVAFCEKLRELRRTSDLLYIAAGIEKRPAGGNGVSRDVIRTIFILTPGLGEVMWKYLSARSAQSMKEFGLVADFVPVFPILKQEFKDMVESATLFPGMYAQLVEGLEETDLEMPSWVGQ